VAPPRFFVAPPFFPSASGETVTLPDAVAHHAVRVLRLPVGAPLRLFDGTGGEYHATIETVDRRAVTVRIDGFDPVDREWPNAPVLVQSVIATDPMDAAIRKAVELGVAAIVPLIASRSQGSLSGNRQDKRLAHWRSIAIAACEQCGRNRVPPIAEPIAFDAWLDATPAAPVAIAGPGATISLAALAAHTPPRTIVIGPEGGFTDDEMANATARGCIVVHLGPRILRADTAAVAALATLAAIAGDAR
jgi:16S rRNA (uracil1498-N3)-methyltransferase